MLDKKVPYYGVIMVKEDDEYPAYTLPEGYSFLMYEKGIENDWAKIETSVGEFDSVEKAKKYFIDEFLKAENEAQKRCIFVKDKNSEIVGTLSVWYGDHFGSDMNQRLHWLSVHPSFQGKGIAKALMTKALDLSKELGNKGVIYLTTQTWSYKAINIYMKFGFKPYKGEKPLNWESNGDSFEKENEKAWNIIFKYINKGR